MTTCRVCTSEITGPGSFLSELWESGSSFGRGI